jgi:hypothetical protein
MCHCFFGRALPTGKKEVVQFSSRVETYTMCAPLAMGFSQIKNMANPSRAAATFIFFGCMGATLYAALGMDPPNVILVIVFCICQTCALSKLALRAWPLAFSATRSQTD